MRQAEAAGGDPRFLREVRGFLIELLQYRAFPLSKRLVILGAFCDQLDQLVSAAQENQIPQLIASFEDAVRRDLFDAAIQGRPPRPAEQLETMLELIVARITSDYTSPRFFECYRQFKEGIAWTADSKMLDIVRNFTAIFVQQYAPHFSWHEHMLEKYLVNHVYRKLFPLKPPATVREQCLLLLSDYGIIQTVLIGMAGFHGPDLAPRHAVQVIQSVTKSFEHSHTFTERALKILAEKGVTNCTGMAALIRN